MTRTYLPHTFVYRRLERARRKLAKVIVDFNEIYDKTEKMGAFKPNIEEKRMALFEANRDATLDDHVDFIYEEIEWQHNTMTDEQVIEEYEHMHSDDDEPIPEPPEKL